MKKRILAMVMTLAMCLSLLPVSALATPDDTGTTGDTSVTEPSTTPETNGENASGEENDPSTDSQPADGKTLYVKKGAVGDEANTYSTIQAAINAVVSKEEKDGWTIIVSSGEYNRFGVPNTVKNLTVTGADDATVTIKKDDSTLDFTFNAEFGDTGCIVVYGEGCTISNMTIESEQLIGWVRAAVYLQGQDLTVKNCDFIGHNSSTYAVFNNQSNKLAITGCSFDGYSNAIEMYCNGVVKGFTIADNTFENCDFAMHAGVGGSYDVSKEGAPGPWTFSNNTVTGTEENPIKIVMADSENKGAFTAIVKDNQFKHTVVSLVNIENPISSDVLKDNAFDAKDGNTIVKGDSSGTIEIFQAPDGAVGKWAIREDNSFSREALNYIQNIINEANASGARTLTINTDIDGDLDAEFTAYKDGVYWSSIPSTSEDSDAWQFSKSKSATKLDKNYESQVTLSLPSAEEELVTDVVFVLDKSTSAELENQALDMLQNLKKQVDDTNAKVKVGVVIFNKEANVANDGNFFDLSTEYNKIQDAIEQEIKSGTNMHAGLLAGKKMLDKDKTVDASRKYLIFVSDGNSYMYGEAPTVTAYYWMNDGVPYFSFDNYAWNFKYENENAAPNDWGEWLCQIGSILDAETDGNKAIEIGYDGDEAKKLIRYRTKGTDEFETTVPDTLATNADDLNKNKPDYAMNVDRALYYSYQVYTAAKEEGYHCYAIAATGNSSYAWASDFMNYLADGEDVDFDDIKKDIYYLLAAGSTVTDVIGSGTDNKGNDYNFDFVNGVNKLTLKVGEDTYTTTKGAITETNTHETARYTFTHDGVEATNNADAPFVLHYYENGVDGNSAECFVWDINVPVTNFAPVSLTYTVKLTNPQTSAGTYGQYDEYGTLNYPGLYTNNRATLSPVDSNGNVGELEWFAKPTVSYTVKSSGGGGGGGGGGSSKPPVLNTEDHFGYIIGYPEHYLTGEACHDQTLMPVKPEGNITRAEVATIFFRMLTDESRNEFWSQTSSYSDVELDDWFNNAICTLSNAGVINGYEDGTFKPNGKITRAEFATIASRFFEYADENMENPFSDVEENTWYYQYIMAASDMGLINGYPDGTFKPDNLITRAEAVTIVNRTLDRHPDQENFLEDMLVWPDNMDTEKWYYADMQEATNSHEYQMKTKNGEKYEVWTKMLPIRDWEAFEKAWSDANSSNNPGEVVK